MARSYARISVQRFSDPDWRTLTMRQKCVYDMLLAHPKLTLCGALDVKLASWCAYSPDLDTGTLTALLEDLENGGWIKWDRDTEELVIRTFVRHDGVLKNRNLGRGMWSAWATIESADLRSFLVDNFPEPAFEPQFEPQSEPPFEHRFLTPKNHRSNHSPQLRSEPQFEPASELPHPQPQPNLKPSSAKRFEHLPVENAGPTVRLVTDPQGDTP